MNAKYMNAALKLARRGIGSVEPNPAVGAVIVKANQVIGKGCHEKFGAPHAEINAIEDCKNIGVNPKDSVMYVTLEPCCHQGKTGPCTEAIIEAGISKVFVAITDPSEHANGAGLEKLRQAGIEVHTGLCETEAKLLNAPFMKFNSTGKCWVTLKWAQSIDGKLAFKQQSEENRWISSELSRKDVHNLRHRAGAILVGINTVLADNPLLTVRPDNGKQPLRIVLDSFLRIPPDCRLLETAKESPLLILTSQRSIMTQQEIADNITEKGAELLAFHDNDVRSNLHFLLDELSRRGLQHLLVEGGPRVLTSFVRENLADEIMVYMAPKILGGCGDVDITTPMAELIKTVDLHFIESERFGDDIRLSGLTAKALTELSIAP